MTLMDKLVEARTAIVDEAAQEVHAMELLHYAQAGPEFTRQRIDDLYGLVLAAVADRDLAQVIRYAEGVAEERFNAGFDVFEVQTAFNALEALTWRHVVTVTPPDELAEAIGLVSTVFGVAKDALSRAYVSLATHRHVRSLDLSALFRGVSSAVPYRVD